MMSVPVITTILNRTKIPDRKLNTMQNEKNDGQIKRIVNPSGNGIRTSAPRIVRPDKVFLWES